MTGERGELDEELQLGPRTRWPAGALARFGWRWRAGAAVVVVAAVAIPLIVTSQPRAPSSAPHSIPRSHSSAPSAVVVQKPPASPKPTVRRTHRFLLGVHRGWELFGRGADGVVRVEFARGRVTTTPVPLIQSTGPVSFVVGQHAALIRPLDFVPGYVVPDGMRAQKPPRSLDCGGPAVPGPRPDTLWVPPCSATSGVVSPRLLLTRFDGTRIGASVPVPGGNSPIEVRPDGQGYLLFPGSVIGMVETFDVRPGGGSSTFDRVVAVGPTRWLVQSCNRVGRCGGDAVVNRTNGKHRRLKIQFSSGDELGVISPDGSRAALRTPAPGAAIMYVDLTTGDFHGLLVQPSVPDEQTMAWSPDSKWLFVLGRGGALYAVNGRTGLVVTDLTARLHLPPLDQLAIRAAPSP